MEPSHCGHAILFLWHPGTAGIFSGYGLVLAPSHLVGVLMVDRPAPADPGWLTWIEHVFGAYQLTAMTQTGERGLVCQMRIAEENMHYLRVLPYPRIGALRDALVPLLQDLPTVTFHLAWSAEHQCWMSRIIDPRVPLFSLGNHDSAPR